MFERCRDVAPDDAEAVGDAAIEDSRQFDELLVGNGRAGEDDVGEGGEDDGASRSVMTSVRRPAMS